MGDESLQDKLNLLQMEINHTLDHVNLLQINLNKLSNQLSDINFLLHDYSDPNEQLVYVKHLLQKLKASMNQFSNSDFDTNLDEQQENLNNVLKDIFGDTSITELIKNKEQEHTKKAFNS